MKISVTKELGTKAVSELGKESVATSFAIEATGITTKEDLQEVIRQVQLVESQITGGSGLFEIKEGSCCVHGNIKDSNITTHDGANVNGFK